MSFFVLDGVFDVEETSIIKWNILDYGDASNTLELKWDIFNDVENELELKWDIPEIPTVDNSVELRWHLLEFTDYSDLELLWDIINYDIPEYQFTTEKRVKSFI